MVTASARSRSAICVRRTASRVVCATGPGDHRHPAANVGYRFGDDRLLLVPVERIELARRAQDEDSMHTGRQKPVDSRCIRGRSTSSLAYIGVTTGGTMP